MKPAHLGFLALALLAGTAGYVLQQYFHRQDLQAAQALGPATPAAAPAPAAGAQPFDWSFADLAGQSQSLGQWRGKLVVLNFWATWCPPCLKEIPAFVELQQRLGGRGLQFVGIALDEVVAVKDFVAEHGVNYPVLVGDQDVARLMSTLGNEVGGLPYTVVIDAGGNIVQRHQGEWRIEDATAVLESHLGSAAGDTATTTNGR